MTGNDIDRIASLAIHATDIFDQCYDQSVTSMGITEQAVVIDCALSQRRLMLITIDEQPGIVGVAIGTKGTNNCALLDQLPIDTLTSSAILKFMEQHFARSPK